MRTDSDKALIKENYGIDLDQDPNGIDKLIDILTEDNHDDGLAGDSEDITIIFEDEE